jgi:transcriptional regulator with XRE-family HTH domain
MTSDGKLIKAARERLGLGTREFAEALGVKRHTIWRYECGDPVPKTTLLAIERLLIAHDERADRLERARERARIARAQKKIRKTTTVKKRKWRAS